MRIKVKHPSNILNGVRLYAQVQSREDKNVWHDVVFVRKPGIRKWNCTCKDQLFRHTGTPGCCDHIKAVRRKLDLSR